MTASNLLRARHWPPTDVSVKEVIVGRAKEAGHGHTIGNSSRKVKLRTAHAGELAGKELRTKACRGTGWEGASHCACRGTGWKGEFNLDVRLLAARFLDSRLPNKTRRSTSIPGRSAPHFDQQSTRYGQGRQRPSRSSTGGRRRSPRAIPRARARPGRVDVLPGGATEVPGECDPSLVAALPRTRRVRGLDVHHLSLSFRAPGKGLASPVAP